MTNKQVKSLNIGVEIEAEGFEYNDCGCCYCIDECNCPHHEDCTRHECNRYCECNAECEKCEFEGFDFDNVEGLEIETETDGSLDEGGQEVKLFGDYKVVLASLPMICEEMQDKGGEISTRCGLHVHLDFSKTTFNHLRRFVALLANNERVFFSLVSQSRRDNRFCLPLDSVFSLKERNKKDLVDKTKTRYHWLNVQALSRHGSVEVRLHNGSLDNEKISKWIELLTACWFYTQKAGADTTCTTLYGLTYRVGLDTISKNYWMNRQEQFKGVA